MEKTSIKPKGKFRNRLLVFVLVEFISLLLPAFSKTLSHSQLKQLKVVPDSKIFFTAQENGYTLKIPTFSPSQVQTDLPELPPGVQLVSSKREEYLDSDGSRGTAVHLWFTFRDTGPVRMPPLIAIIGYRTYYLAFESVEVYENPAVIAPVMDVNFEGSLLNSRSVNGVKEVTVNQGDELIISVSLKYFVQILKFSWTLPKNSIFKELERYDITRGGTTGSEFSAQLYPVARFSWKILESGTYTCPEFAIIATAYNGSKKQVALPQCRIIVKPSANYSKKNVYESFELEKADEVFKSAFEGANHDSIEDEEILIRPEDCKKLAELRSKERMSLPFSAASRERRQIEYKLYGNEGGDEPGVLLFIAGLAVCFVLLVLFIVSVFIWHGKKVQIFFVLLFVVLVLTIKSGAALLPEWGVFAGGNVSPVPEAVTSSSHNASSCKRVKILEKAGDYYYIDSEEINGWVLKDLVFEIN